jgi:hypothetical protein
MFVDESKSLWQPIVAFVIGLIVYGMGIEPASTIVVASLLWFVILLFKKL